jgi:hypothetical protein
MKFKYIMDEACRRMECKSVCGSSFTVETFDDGGPGLAFIVNGQMVEVSDRRALKLAWAIIDELNTHHDEHLIR